MFTKKTLLGLKSFFFIHNLVKAGPFYWKTNGSDHAPVRTHTGKAKWLIITAVVAWMYTRMVYATFNLFFQLFAGAPVKSCAVNFMYVQYYISLLFYHINIFRNMHQIKEFLNCLLHFNNYAAGRFQTLSIYFHQIY